LKAILVILSSLRMDHVGVYGNRWIKTENLDTLAKNGRVFTNAKGPGLDSLAFRTELLTGQDLRRWKNTSDLYRNLQPQYTLAGQLESLGCPTALFTDNYPFLPFYESLNSFGTVHFVPGQGADRHIPGKLPQTTFDLEESGFDAVESGSSESPGERDMDLFVRNRSFYGSLGHPSHRLFEAARDFSQKQESRDWFILVYSFGLTPPWDAPVEFARYRTSEDQKTLAWPVAGEVSTGDKDLERRLKFLRRCYADNCLFIDHLIGKLVGQGITLIVMSDHGVHIGDENTMIGRQGMDSDVLTRQVLIVNGPKVEKGSTSEDPIQAGDIFKNLLKAAGAKDIAGPDLGL